MKSDYPPDHAKLHRLLEFIHLLRPPGRSKQDLKRHFDCSEKTIGRYLKTLDAANFFVEKDEAGRHFIIEPLTKGITMHVSAEEAELLYELINNTAPVHPLAAPLLSKLLFNTELGNRVKNTFRQTTPEVIVRLSEAMKLNRQIRISEYVSASRGEKRERLLQPLNFTENFNYLIAYEESEQKKVNLKTDRILDVTVLEINCTVPPDVEVDIFQMAANQERHEVGLLLNHLAYRLLLESNSRAEQCISPSGNMKFPFRFVATVFNFLPVGRFVLGLPGSILVEGPEELKGYLREKIGRFLV